MPTSQYIPQDYQDSFSKCLKTKKKTTNRANNELTRAGFMNGLVTLDPTINTETVAIASKKVLASSFRGPLRIISKTKKVTQKLRITSAIAPMCASTFNTEAPPIIVLYFSGITSMIVIAPPAAPTA